MVAAMYSHAENGLYAAAYKIPTLLTYAVGIFDSAWRLSVAAEADNREACAAFYTRVWRWYTTLSFVGGAVLILFGLNTLLGAFGKSLLPGLSLQVDSASVFLQGLVLTLSNPITIVFWGSVLTGKIIEDDLKARELRVFSLGLVSATLFFLSAIAGLGTVLSSFLPEAVSMGLNVLVGVLIVFFGVKMMVKKDA